MDPSSPAQDCSTDRWSRLDQLFEAACALPVAERPAFLERACGDDTELRLELTSLLRHAPADPTLPSLPAASKPDSLLGRTLRHYTIEARLGGGGMGVVYLAHDLLLDRPVALKFLSPTLSTVPTAKQRFLVEARAAAAIDHPNICTVYEVGEADDGAPFIAMAYYQGETLKEKLSRGRLAIEEAIDYVRQTAEGVRAAHACGVIHRDVKPGNIFITREGIAKLLDFGVAKKDDLALTKAGVALGTLGYMSPEQLRGERVDAGTDIWSLGVVLFEALASHPPFQGTHAALIMRSAFLDQVPPLALSRPDAPPALDRVLGRALAKRSGDRYGTVAAFLADLRIAVAEQGKPS